MLPLHLTLALSVSDQPLHPLKLAALGDWPAPTGALHKGDVRATLSLSGSAARAPTVDAVIWWRRRDPYPERKGVLVTDGKGNAVPLASPPLVSGPCGVISFVPNSDTTYHVYFLPYYQSGGGANLHFHWYNCSSHTDRSCVMAIAPLSLKPLSTSPAACTATAGGGARASVVALEGRQVAASYGPSDFHALSPMELVATPEERAALLAAPAAGSSGGARVFLEPRTNAVRMDDQLPASWARGGERTALRLSASAGEFLTFQVGVYGVANLSRFQLRYGELRPIEARGDAAAGAAVRAEAAVPASAFTCFNLGGVDYHGQPFDRTASYAVAAGAVGSLWVGVELPTAAVGIYRGNLSLTARTGGGGASYGVALSLTLDVRMPRGGPLARHGDGDIYSMSRLRWLDSTVGIDDSVPSPFVPPRVVPQSPTGAGGGGGGGGGGAGFTVALLNKRIAVGTDGLFAQVAVDDPAAGSAAAATPFTLLTRPMGLRVLRAGARLPLSVVRRAAIVGQNQSGVYWEAALAHQGELHVQARGALEYDLPRSPTISDGSPGAWCARVRLLLRVLRRALERQRAAGGRRHPARAAARPRARALHGGDGRRGRGGAARRVAVGAGHGQQRRVARPGGGGPLPQAARRGRPLGGPDVLVRLRRHPLHPALVGRRQRHARHQPHRHGRQRERGRGRGARARLLGAAPSQRDAAALPLRRRRHAVQAAQPLAAQRAESARYPV